MNKKTHNSKKLTLRSPGSFQKLDTFSAQRDELFHQNLSKARHEKSSSKIVSNKKKSSTYIISGGNWSRGVEGSTRP
jgi:hypothetical protein